MKVFIQSGARFTAEYQQKETLRIDILVQYVYRYVYRLTYTGYTVEFSQIGGRKQSTEI